MPFIWYTDALCLLHRPIQTHHAQPCAHHPLAEADALAGLEDREIERAGRLLRSYRDGIIGVGGIGKSVLGRP